MVMFDPNAKTPPWVLHAQQPEEIPNQFGAVQEPPARNGGGMLGLLRGIGQRVQSVDPMTWALISAGIANARGGSPIGNLMSGISQGVAQSKQWQSLKEARADRAAAAEEGRRARAEVTKIAQDILGNLDRDKDGRVSEEERAIGVYARLAAADPQRGGAHLAKATELITNLLAPREPAKPQSSIAKLQADLDAGLIDQSQYDQGIAVLTKPLVQMNQGDKQLGADAKLLRGPNNELPNPTWTWRQALDSGFRMVSGEHAKGAESAAGAAPVLAATMKFGLGRDGASLFPPGNAGTARRLLGGAKAKWQSVVEDPSNPDLIMYDRTRDATLSGLARLTGQVGSLTDLDVETVRSLWPTAGLTPEPIAKAQFQQIIGLLRAKGLGEQLIQSIFPEELLTPEKTATSPGGVPYTVDE